MLTLFSLSKSSTSIALDISEIALLLFGIVLTAGLIGEYAKSERWKKYVKTFELLVIIGVAGELFADGGIFLFSTNLQTIADQEIAELTKKAADLRTKYEESENKRVELERDLAQRTFIFMSGGGQSNVDPLRKFPGIKVILEYIRDAEAERAAASIESIAKDVQWDIVSATPQTGLFEGVTIRAGGVQNGTPQYEYQRAAGEALKELLESSGWTGIQVFPDSNTPFGSLKIQVGFKSSPYFEPPEKKEIDRLMKEFSEFARTPGVSTEEISRRQQIMHDKITKLMEQARSRTTPNLEAPKQ